MSAPISSVGEWRTNAELIADVARLGYLPGPVLDLTYNAGKFWSVWRPASLTTNDLDQQWCTDHHEDFRSTSFQDGEFATVVLDPPYKLSGTNRLGEFDRQYGTTATRSRQAVHALLVAGIAEASRIASEFVLVKCQDQVCGGEVRWQSAIAYDVARALEMTQADEFLFNGGGPPQDAARGQQHARHERSVLMVFGKPGANARRKKAMKGATLFDCVTDDS